MLLTGTWSTFTTAVPNSNAAELSMLLPNGNLIVHTTSGNGVQSASTAWYQVTPDANGAYNDGTWTAIAPMNVSRLWFGSTVLPSGKVFVVGGEYASDGAITQNGVKEMSSSAEMYDPSTGTWTSKASDPVGSLPNQYVGDSPAVLLPNGNVLVGDNQTSGTEIYNPNTNTWTTGATKVRSNDPSFEETWVKLPNNDILCYDVSASITAQTGKAEIYDPTIYNPTTGTLGTWSDASPGVSGVTGVLPVLSASTAAYEIGAAVVLPNGNALLTGANGQTAEYNSSTKVWSAGPTMPVLNGVQLTMGDAAAAVLPNGNVLMTMSPEIVPNGTGYTYPPTTYFYEFNPTSNAFLNVTPSNFPAQHSVLTTMLVLPTGQVMVDYLNNSTLLYTPDGAPAASWRPQITNVASNGGSSYTITGTQLNGLNEGSSFGDDNQNATNYPIVRVTDTTNGHVYYAATSNWSSTGIATGTTSETVNVQMPSALGSHAFSLVVIADGIASSPSSFQFSPSGTLYQLQYGGNLNFWNGSSWTTAIANVRSFGFTPNGDLFALLAGGVLYNTTFNNTISGVSSFQIDPSGNVFAVISGNQNVWDPSTNTWSVTIYNVVSFAFTPSGTEFALLTTGMLYSTATNGTVSSGVTAYQIAPNGIAYSLQSGNLYYWTGTVWSLSTANVSSFSFTPNGTLYFIIASNLYVEPPSGNVALSLANVSSFQVAANGEIYALQTNGTLNIAENNSWISIATNVTSIQMAPDNRLFVLKSNKNLYYCESTSLTLADGNGNVNTYQVLPNGILYVNGSLYWN